MNQLLQQDTDLTHGLVNYLNSSYRGRLASLNALLQMNSQEFSKEELIKTEKTLEIINRWLSDLWNGLPLVSTGWQSPETFEAQRVFDLLNESKLDLKQLSQKFSSLLNSNERYSNDENIKIIISGIVRLAYQRDNFIKGFLEYAKVFAREDLYSHFEAFLPTSNDEVKLANSFLKEFKSAANLRTEFFDNLDLQLITIPSTLNVFIHEMNFIGAVYSPDFSFRHAEIPEDEFYLWEQLGLSAREAGYWRAYGITPDQALSWIEQNMRDANVAGNWSIRGFNPPEVFDWLKLGLSPAVALLWRKAGYDLDTVRVQLNKGYLTPKDLAQNERPLDAINQDDQE